jgi:hypothetical protein
VTALESTMIDINRDATRDHRYKSFKFIVWIDDQPVAGFSEMTWLQNAEITLERGLTHDKAFGHWVSEVSDSSAATRKDLQIDVLDACQSLPDLDANTTTVAIATLELETEQRAASEEPS